MATITLKDVPAELHRRLSEQAKAHKRSLNREAISCLEAELLPRPIDPETFLEEIRENRRRLRESGVPSLDETFLKEARDRGRE